MLLHISTFYHFYEASLYKRGKQDSERIIHLTSNDETGLVSLKIQTCLLGPEGLGIEWKGNENQRSVQFDWRKLFWVSLNLALIQKGQTAANFAFKVSCPGLHFMNHCVTMGLLLPLLALFSLYKKKKKIDSHIELEIFWLNS